MITGALVTGTSIHITERLHAAIPHILSVTFMRYGLILTAEYQPKYTPQYAVDETD